MRPLSVITPQVIDGELRLMASGSYNLSRRARELGVKYGTLRHHLRNHRGPRIKKPRKPVMGLRLKAILEAGDQMEKQLGITSEPHREARTKWRAAKKVIYAFYEAEETAQ